jgi:hypothetical protein
LKIIVQRTCQTLFTVQALLHNSQEVDKKNEFLWHFYNNFRLSQGQLKTYATTPTVHCSLFTVH